MVSPMCCGRSSVRRKNPWGVLACLGNPDEVVVMEASIDDLNPEIYPYLDPSTVGCRGTGCLFNTDHHEGRQARCIVDGSGTPRGLG